MKIKLKNTRINVQVLFAGILAAMLAIDKSGVCARGLCACVLHETGHLLCLYLLGDYPISVTLSFYGMMIENPRAQSENQLQQALVAASGPAINFLLYLLFRHGSELFAAVNLLTGLFNSLPCLPLDGGRVAYFLLMRWLGAERAPAIISAVSVITLCLCMGAGVILLLCAGNFTLLAVDCYLVFAFLKERKDMV